MTTDENCDCCEEPGEIEFVGCGTPPVLSAVIGSPAGSVAVLSAVIPETLTAGHFRAAAKALRGHHVRQVRDWLNHVAGWLDARAAAK
jgi:hypothetical protein